MSGTLGSVTTTYASVASYAPQGAPQRTNLNNGNLIEQTCFNSRLQPTTIRQRTGGAASSCSQGSNDVGYLSYSYSGTNNNGEVAGQSIYHAASGSNPARSFQQSYTAYDGVGRLGYFQETAGGNTWSQTYQ